MTSSEGSMTENGPNLSSNESFSSTSGLDYKSKEFEPHHFTDLSEKNTETTTQNDRLDTENLKNRSSSDCQTTKNPKQTVSGGPQGEELVRVETGYSVKEIYPDLNHEDIKLRRLATRSTILTSLSNRAQDHFDTDDNEKNIGEKSTSDDSNTYDKLPDTGVPAAQFGGEFSSIDPELVTWDGVDDPEYPRNWSKNKKVLQTAIVSFYTLVSPMTSSVLSPAIDEIATSLNMQSSFLKSFSVSVMVLAWALGPLLIAPLSESDAVGRMPVLHVSIWINCFFLLGCGFCKTTAQLCIFRFLGGLGGCAALNVGAGSISDLWSDSERQVAMAFYSICPTLGPIISPIVSSWVVEYTDWRWCFWVLCIFNAVVAIVGLILFEETYSPKLLKTKVRKLRKESGNENLHTIYEIADGETTAGRIWITCSRPVKLLFTHPMIIGLGSFMAFTYGFMYLMIVTFPAIWKVQYGYSTGISGLLYLPMGIGYVIGTLFWTPVMSKIYFKMKKNNNGVAKPEYRLPCLCLAGLGVPIGLIWYGWTAEKKLIWILPAIGTGIFAFFFIAVFLTIQNYLIDMNNRFAASSMAAAAVFRSIFGFTFPLFASPMYAALGYGWGNTMFGLIGIILGIPFPIFCFKYGERLREWANKRMNASQAKRDAKNLERLHRMQQQGLTKY